MPLVERAIQAHRQGAIETAERLCLDVLELAPDRPGALSVLYQIRKAQGKHTRRRGADPPHRRARSQQLRRHQRTRPAAAGQGQPRRGRDPRPQRRPHRPGEPAGAQPDGHDHDRGATGRRSANTTTAACSNSAAQRDPILLANLAWNLKNQGRMEEAPRALSGIRRRRARHPPDPARLGPAGGSRPQFRRRRPRCSTGWSNDLPERSGGAADARGAAGPDEALRRGAGGARRHGESGRRRPARAERTAGEGPAARPDGPLRRRLGRLRGRQAAGARTVRASRIWTTRRSS